MHAPLASRPGLRALAVQPPPAPRRVQRRRDGAFQPPLASLSAVPPGRTVQRKCNACAAKEETGERMPVQPRLEVGPAGDRYEKEADAIAGRVMAMRDADAAAAAPAVQRACAACSSADEEPRARRSSTGGGETIAASHAELTSGGSPLPPQTRRFFEPRLGRDLGSVRVHQGESASGHASAIQARAFTYRDHIWLGASETAAPSFTMAHELAHVMQQTAPGPLGPRAVAARREASAAPERAQRAPPVAAGAAAAAAPLTITAAIGKCIVGAVIGAALDTAVQAAMHAIRSGSLRVWEMTVDYCSMILSAAVGCVAAPISARWVEPAILARNPSLAARQGTTLGWLLLKGTAAARMALPKLVVSTLLKLGCIDSGTASRLGGGGDDPGPAPPEPPGNAPGAPGSAPAPSAPRPAAPAAAAPLCAKASGGAAGHERILMKVNTTEFADEEERTRLDIFADGIRPTAQKVIVHGLASTDGPTWFNERLSCSRAIAGRDHLLQRGIGAERIVGVFQHGEVEGPADWERSVVFELAEGGGGSPGTPGREAPAPDAPAPAPPGRTPAPRPGSPVPPPAAEPSTPPSVPGPSPAPAPNAPAVAPRITLKKLRFTSDHNLLQVHDKDWNLGGSVAKPEWTPASPGALAAPISQTKATAITAEAEVDVEPVSAASAPVTLRGEATAAPLSMRGTVNIGGGLGQKIPLRASVPLGDGISSIEGQSIYWISETGGVRAPIAASHGHEVLVTHGVPKGPLTTKRARKAIELTQGAGNNPHKIIAHQVRSYGTYRLGSAVTGEPWQFADIMPPEGKGADCQSIVRFIGVINDAIGLPGEAQGLAVYADPADPATPKTSPLEYMGGSQGGMFKYPGYHLVDGSGWSNNYEATLQYSLGKSEFFPDLQRFERFYPGGVPAGAEGVRSLTDVLHVFTEMVRVHTVEENGKPVQKIEEVICYRGRAECDQVEYRGRPD